MRIKSSLIVEDQLSVGSIPHMTIPATSMIVSDSGVLKYRTLTEVLGDLSIPVPTLQQVTQSGRSTTLDITASELRSKPSYTSNWVAALTFTGNGTNAEGNLLLRSSSTGNGNVATIGTTALSAYRNILVPDFDGVLMGSVNSVTADNFGNVLLTTANIAENTNLYYTDVRVDARITLQKGAALGITPLDASGKISSIYLPDSILGQVKWKGLYDASTGVVPAPASTSTGWYYVISVAGTIGGTDYLIGDWIISDGTSWGKVDNTDAVTTVFGRIGTILAIEADYSAYYPVLSGSYNNPSWINQLAWSKLTGTPTTIAGYNITDGLTLTTAASTYFPLVGGTLTGTGGNGYVGLPSQSANPGAVSGVTKLFADATGRLSWITGLGHSRTFTSTTLVADRVYTLQDANGTIAFTSDIPTALSSFTNDANYVKYTVANTYTAGFKQTFTASATTAGFAHASVTADPSSLSAGDMWYRSDLGRMRYQDGTTTRSFLTEALTQTVTNKDFTSSTNTFPSKTLNSLALNTYAALGSVVKAEPIGITAANITTSLNQTSGIAFYTAVFLPTDQTILGVKWWQNVAGSYTASNFNGVALYSIDGVGNLTQVAISVNDGTIWQGAQGWQSKAFSGTGYIATAGVYYIGYLYSSSAQVTAPAFGGAANVLNTNVRGLDFVSSYRLTTGITGQTALASGTVTAGSIIGTVTSAPYFALY